MAISFHLQHLVLESSYEFTPQIAYLLGRWRQHRMKMPSLSHIIARFRDLNLRTKFLVALGIPALLVTLVAVIVIPTINQLIIQYDLTFKVEGRLSNLAEQIRYYDAVLTDSVRSYVMNPADNSSYVRYNEYAVALDGVIAEARSLVTERNSEDLQFFEDIDRVNQELIAIERNLMAEPSIAIADSVNHGLR